MKHTEFVVTLNLDETPSEVSYIIQADTEQEATDTAIAKCRVDHPEALAYVEEVEERPRTN